MWYNYKLTSEYKMTEKKKPIDYVDNKKFYLAMVDYIALCRKAEAEDKEPPQIPNYIGECIGKIASNLSNKVNFVNYSFKEEMVGDGIESCIRYIRNFDPDRSTNPFSYFTQFCWNAFIHRILKEQKQQYIKYKSMERHIIHDMQGESFQYLKDSGHNFDTSDNLISSFEAKLEKKKIDAKAKIAKAFPTEEEENEA